MLCLFIVNSVCTAWNVKKLSNSYEKINYPDQQTPILGAGWRNWLIFVNLMLFCNYVNWNNEMSFLLFYVEPIPVFNKYDALVYEPKV